MKNQHGREIVPTQGDLPPMATPLLDWYDENARVLPWRQYPTPYRVWVSEIMLQQTRVQAVLPYFARFMEALPTIEALANAPEDTLTKLWEGLGYYSRVRNLQKAARLVTAHYGGQLPDSYEELLKLPGIGAYTAGAVASIAYQIPVPAVDGNVLRVLARVVASEEDVGNPQVKKAFTALAAQLQPQDRPGDFNQALMELGATVCLPNGAPLCHRCPVAGLCKGYQLDIAQTLPVKAPKAPRRVEDRTVLAVIAREKVLLCRRPSKGLLAGLWELPNLPGRLTGRQAAEAVESWGGAVQGIAPLGQSRHIFTHIQWEMEGYELRCAPFPPPEGFVWASGEELAHRYALPSALKAYTRDLPDRLSGQSKEDRK